MDRIEEMAFELENMIEAGEVEQDLIDEVSNMIQELKGGKKNLNDFYRASTPHKLLDVLDEVNQRVSR